MASDGIAISSNCTLNLCLERILLCQITTHFTDMCTPHFFFASEQRSTVDAGLVTKFGAFSSLNFPKLI